MDLNFPERLRVRLYPVLGVPLLLSACAVTSAPEVPERPAARIANPAVVRCLAEGWRVEPVLVNGVPADHVCIEPGSGRRCPAWAYFRSECPATTDPVEPYQRRSNPPKSADPSRP